MSSMTTTDNKAFLNELARLVVLHLLTNPAKTAAIAGLPFWSGDALAVVFLGSLLELWRVLKACVTADKNYSDAGRQYRPDRRIDAKR